MAEFVAATAAEMLEGVASIPPQGAEAFDAWAAEQAFGPSGTGTPIYRWNFDPAADEAFSKLVDETSADGAWEAWKESDGFVNPAGNAGPNPTVKASPQTAIKKTGAASATAGGLLSMSLPTWVAAAAPLIGVAVGVGLYELNPTLWEKISRTLLPFCYEDSQAMPVVTDEDGNTYIDRDAVTALKNLFEEEGIPVTGDTGDSEATAEQVSYYGDNWDVSFATTSEVSHTDSGITTYTEISSGSAIASSVKTSDQGFPSSIFVSKQPFTLKIWRVIGGESTVINVINSTSTTITRTGETVYYAYPQIQPDGIPSTIVPSIDAEKIADIILNGNASYPGEYQDGTSKWNGEEVDIDNLPITDVYTSPDGESTKEFIPVALPTQPGESLNPEDNPDPTENSDPERQISPYIMPTIPRNQYPSGSDSTGDQGQPLDKDAPIPTPIPNQDNKPNPQTDPSKPSEYPPQKIIDIFPAPDIGDLIPTDGLPTSGALPTGADGGVGGLVSVYNPTYSELSAFAQWLWVTYADATIDKIWNNPFDGIISLHELYATPNVGGRKYIKSGFLVSPVEADTIPDRYSEINCGTAIFPEYYGNYLDYSPYSKALVYLPFIGIEELNVDDIVGHAVNITYRVDSYSGACIALITCAKEGSSAILYQFCGNCSVQLPIAGGTQAAIKAAQISAGAYQNAYHVAGIAGLAGGIASGVGSLLMGNIGGLLGSAVHGLGSYASNQAMGNANAISQTVSAKSSVQHSGQFGESFGAMGNKKPYMIIKRPVQVEVPNYQDEYGYPAHKYVTIGECTGYLRCRAVHVASARATDEERQRIEKALTEGVFMT